MKRSADRIPFFRENLKSGALGSSFNILVSLPLQSTEVLLKGGFLEAKGSDWSRRLVIRLAQINTVPLSQEQPSSFMCILIADPASL